MRSDRLAWPLLLLLLTVLVPSAGVVWMMREAVRNEQLAANQRLRDAYQTQLDAARQTLEQRWSERLRRLADRASDQQPAAAFAEIVASGEVDSLLISDANARVVYPDRPAPPPEEPAAQSAEWASARRLEFAERRFEAAAEAYALIARDAADEATRASARQSQVRCLLAAGEREAAVEVLQTQFAAQEVFDGQGRSPAAVAGLRLLELLPPDSPEWRGVADQLVARLNDYQQNPLLATQRRFLMEELRRWPELGSRLPTLPAETLAAEAAEAYDAGFATDSLRPTPLTGVWSQSLADGRVVALHHADKLRQRLLALTDDIALPSGVAFTAHQPGGEPSGLLLDAPLGEGVGQWRLGLEAAEGDPFAASSRQRHAVHLWITVLVIAATVVLAWLLIAALRQRLRLAQLKNDLVATVSHELKTPLASIRLLVDTLLAEGGSPTDANAREYLELISQENARLTRLIDNFLTFSRMERGSQRFASAPVEVQEVVRQAASVFREHVGDDGGALRVDPGPPAQVLGDADALVSAVVNLLENAWKYSGEAKRIELSAGVVDGRVAIVVRDNGIGLSTQSAARVFDRFYQVDQRVARDRGGCGLGLSIVRTIVEAHGGEATVESRPGEGSAFTLWLPELEPRRAAASERPAGEQEQPA
ncbi:Signal-transduction histidine kinase senX3 [Posidoniimonas corsicana]|uniref:histidine kinase n=1 Tax=Posidoniimonas corsicana TaxID=1938618 RepID=A0A5C5VGZ8_9BACT|nr:HAMP domain-containing sensor histidine kinase [Posidoniimonas corsicana]TWT36932.1 Signal-transduction histidine kinase senX3 [Posidoniimonas corsicana]